MKNYFFCLLSAVLISSPSYAQSPFEGFNAGIITGAINGKFTISTYTPYLSSTGYSEADETYFGTRTNASNVSESGSGKFSKTRVPVGLSFGYNKDFGAWGLAGIKADLSSIGLKESKTNSTTYSGIGLTPETTIYLRADNLATLRAKYGFTVDQTSWIYLTGGVAFADIESKTTFTDGTVTESNNQSEHKTGWVAGIGVEKMIDKCWSINAEYHYTAFGNITGTSRNMADNNNNPFSNQPFTTTTKLNLNAFEIGISKHF